MSGKPTITDIAMLAGVSRATVSRVLNGTAKVTDATADAVNAAITQTGYIVNAQARALSLGRTNLFGVILTEPFDELYEDPTYAAIMRGINSALSESEISPVLFQAYTESERSKAAQIMRRGAIDALIHLSPFDDLEGLETMRDVPIPVVMCGQIMGADFTDVFSCVYADDVVGAEIAARHVQELDRRNIAMILGAKDAPATHDRLIGYRNLLGSLITDDHIRYGQWDQLTGSRAMADLLEVDPGIDMLICGSDRIAAGTLDLLRARGIRVPEDISIIGFDDHRIAVQTDPQLTTIAQPMFQQGATAVQLALDMITGAPARTVVLDMELKKRATT